LLIHSIGKLVIMLKMKTIVILIRILFGLLLAAILIYQFFYVRKFIRHLSPNKQISAKLDLVLDTLRKENTDNLNVFEFCRGNIKYEDTEYKNLINEKRKEADSTYTRIIARLVEGKIVERIDTNKNYLTITDKGIIFNGYIKARLNRIKNKIYQHLILFTIIAGFLHIVFDFWEKKLDKLIDKKSINRRNKNP
jgi:hypothetical protein